MKTYAEMVADYKKRQHDTLVDTINTGLTYIDEIAVDGGLLTDTGIWNELTETACGILPFAVIAVSEGTRVILGKKSGMRSVKDGAWRMAKTGAAMGIGSLVAGTAGLIGAIPAAMGVRALFDTYRSKALTGHRVASRIDRLKELNTRLRNEAQPEAETMTVLQGTAISVPAEVH